MSQWLKIYVGKIVKIFNLVDGDKAPGIVDCEIIDVSLVLEKLVVAFFNSKILCIISGEVVLTLKYFRGSLCVCFQ